MIDQDPYKLRGADFLPFNWGTLRFLGRTMTHDGTPEEFPIDVNKFVYGIRVLEFYNKIATSTITVLAG